MNDELAPLLSTLPQPAAPPSLAAAVMARIEREVTAHDAAAAPVGRAPAGETRMWVPATLGVLLVTAATVWTWYQGGLPDLTSPRLFAGGIKSALSGWPAIAAALAGCALCLRALFSPLRTG